MKNRKNYIKFLGGVTLGIIVIAVVVCLSAPKVKLSTKVNSKEYNSSNMVTVYKEKKEEIKSNIKNYVTTQKEKAKIKKENKKIAKQVEKEDKVVDNILNQDIVTDNKSEKIINYFETLDETVFTEENISKFNSEVKTSFITITDFIFYGTSINGYTFNQLTEQAKLYVIDIAIKVDSKIEQYHPGYKEEIQSDLINIKEQATAKYLEVSEKICTRMGTAACNQAKNDLEVMKENFGLTINFAKVVGRQGLNSLKNWYEIFRES